MTPDLFISFKSSIAGIDLPKKFTFPFYYDPHPLAILASEELQAHITEQKDWVHNFGLDPNQDGLIIGKMFGVLVVENEKGELGYLAAFSGKLANENHHPLFVPPVFDMLTDGSFFQEGIKGLNLLNSKCEQLENDAKYIALCSELKTAIAQSANLIESKRESMRIAKAQRKQRRLQGEQSLNAKEYGELKELLIKESLRNKHELRLLTEEREQVHIQLQQQIAVFEEEITQIKSERKATSARLQQQLFEEYSFLNKAGKSKSLLDIFSSTALQKPPAGAGECAAPKLLQYAFIHGMKPIAMAEFWWGASPKSEVRKHAHYYPACRGKCEPILAHMLDGIQMDDNPMLDNPAEGKELETVYEDDVMIVVNKPADFLSVPGKTIKDSVYTRIQEKYPDATGPLIIHRLDMSTSGLLVLAKTKEANKRLQEQFINRTVNKRYIALLDGIIEQDEGLIDLPLRLDIEDRPRQLVCYEHGKPAQTRFKVLDRTNGKTRIQFFPITGRTHQLRMHAAHSSGLNTPIVGDDLYGKRAHRLHLHAEFLELMHPVTRKKMKFKVAPDF